MHIWIDPETAAPDEAITKLSVAQCGCNNERRRGRRVAILGAMLVGWDLDSALTSARTPDQLVIVVARAKSTRRW